MGKLSLYPTLVPRLNKSPPPLILQFKSLVHLTVSKYTFVLDNKAEIIILKVLRLNCDSSSFRFSRLNLIASSSYDCSFPGEPQNWSSHSLSPSSWSQMCLTLTQNRRHNVYELQSQVQREGTFVQWKKMDMILTWRNQHNQKSFEETHSRISSVKLILARPH